MTDGLSLSTTIHGRVATVNDKGFRLDGEDGWLNYSKYAVGIVAPTRGQAVAVTVDRAGFVRSVTALESAAGAPAPLPVAGGSHHPDKDRTITRLAVLKAAAEFAASRPGAKSTDVLKVAACWERWVLRGDDDPEPDPGLVDAF